MDDNKLIRISKKYTNRSIKSWEKPPKHIVSSVNKILQMNKTKALQVSASSKKTANLIQQDIDLNEFIKLFLKQLRNTKLPHSHQQRQLNELDYDHDYQLKREAFLTNLYSNELNQVENLKNTLKEENLRDKSITKFVKNYEKLYKEELKKLESIDELPQSSSMNTKRKNKSFDTLQLNTEEESEDIENVLKQLETQLDKIDDNTKHFQELSRQIDQLLNQM